MSQIEYRIELLARYIEEEGKMVKFDYSPESLVPLWEWYEDHIVVEKKTRKEYQEELDENPAWMHEDISTTKISLMKTMKFGSDIAIYFGEVIRRNSGGKIYWGYYTRPKDMFSVNRPVLLGFKAKMSMDPQQIVYVCTLESAEKREKTKLYDTFNVWQQFIV